MEKEQKKDNNQNHKERITKTSNAVLLGGVACNLSHLEDEVITLGMADAQLSRNHQRVVLYPAVFEQYGFSVPNLGRVFKSIRNKKNKINRAHYIYDAKTKTDKIIWMFDNIEYHRETGALEILFTESFSEHFNEIKAGIPFSKISLPVHMGFQTHYGKKLFEILSTEAYQLQKYQEVEIVKNLYDLKFALGCIKKGFDTQIDDMIEQYGDSFTGQDFFREYPEAEMFKDIDNFKRVVLNKAKSDFNQQIEQHRPLFDFTYRLDRNGRGGATTGIIFTIFYREGTTPLHELEKQIHSKSGSDSVAVTEDGVEVVTTKATPDESLVADVMKIFRKGEPARFTDIYGLLEESNNNIEKIREVYEYALKKENIDNLIGYMRRLLRDGISEIPSDSRFKTADETIAFRQRCKEAMERYRECSTYKQVTLEELKEAIVYDCTCGDIIAEMPKYANLAVEVRKDDIVELALAVEIGDYLLTHFLGDEYVNALGMFKASTILPRTDYDIKSFIWKTLFSWKYKDDSDDFLASLVDSIYALD